MVEQPDDVHQRGLAGARRPHDREHLASADLEVDAAQGAHLDIVKQIALGHVARLEHGVDRARRPDSGAHPLLGLPAFPAGHWQNRLLRFHANNEPVRVLGRAGQRDHGPV